tara:strand:+ start:206 stop:646 length:441 start_codon:yes stop_codon:yes gene_type:complete
VVTAETPSVVESVTEYQVASEQLLVIPGTLPQLNDVIRTSKGHWHNYANLKKRTEKFIEACILQQKLKPCNEGVWFHFSWISKDYKVDPDNLAFAKKYIIDALVSQKIITQDGRSTVRGFMDDFPAKDPENPRIEVVIFELSQEKE